MIIEHLSVGALQCNCSILGCAQTGEAIIIDPGDEAPRIIEILNQHKLKPKYILHTHAHFDHVGASKEIHQHCKSELCLHKEDQFLYDIVPMQAQMFGLPAPEIAPISYHITEGDVLKFGSYQLQVLHTPGHSPGSLSFVIDSPTEGPQLFAGDTLFQGSIGRTDLWGGDYETILRSIKKKLLSLAPETTVHCGHGPSTTVAFENKNNPFLR